MDSPRTAELQRLTNETKINVSINLDSYPGNSFGAKQEINVSTGIGFLDHVRVLSSLTADELKEIACVVADIDVQCAGQALRHVSHDEMRGGSLDRRPPHSR